MERVMDSAKITAIIRSFKLEEVERHLQDIGVKGISVSRVKGYGEHKNFFRRDWMETYVRIEIFCCVTRAEEIVQAIINAAHSGFSGDGIIAVTPVEKIFRIQTKAEAAICEI